MRLKRRTLDAMFDIGYQVITTRLVKLRRLKEVTKVRACVRACAEAEADRRRLSRAKPRRRGLPSSPSPAPPLGAPCGAWPCARCPSMSALLTSSHHLPPTTPLTRPTPNPPHHPHVIPPLVPVQDRRVLICAYALARQDVHVVFIDCWRRWRTYHANAVRWTAVAWNFQVGGSCRCVAGYSAACLARGCKEQTKPRYYVR
jgi:hypothetical protein